MSKPIYSRIDDETHGHLTEIAAKEDRTVSSLVAHIIRKFLATVPPRASVKRPANKAKLKR